MFSEACIKSIQSRGVVFEIVWLNGLSLGVDLGENDRQEQLDLCAAHPAAQFRCIGDFENQHVKTGQDGMHIIVIKTEFVSR